jgi:glycerol-3-phosphate acyltransferase PlsY
VAPIAAPIALVVCIVLSLARRSFAFGARVAVFGVPLVQLAVDPVEHVAATGGLMTLVGALFGLRALQARHGARLDAVPPPH